MLTGTRLAKGVWIIVGANLLASGPVPLFGQEEEETEKESQYTLPEVTVTATRLEQPLKEVPLSTSVITRDALESSPALDLGDILRTQAGVHVRSFNRGGVATASLRGAQSTQVLVVRDGIPINNAFNGLADLSQLSLDGMDRVEIVRGPTSHLYGANALGGVINLITREPERKTDITISSGSFNTQQYHLLAGRGGKARGAWVSAAVKRSDGWRGNDDFLHRSLLGKLTTIIGGVRASLMTGYYDSEVGVPGPKPDNATTYGNSDVTSLFDRQRTDNFYGLLFIESKLGNNTNLQLRLRPERHATTFSSKFDDWLTGETILGHDQYVAKNVRLSGQVEKGSGTNRLLAGFEVIRQRGFVDQKTTLEATGEDSTLKWNPSARSSALWTEYIRLGTNSVIVFGVRLDNHSVYGWHTSPSLGIILRRAESTLRFSIGNAYRAPSFNDLFWPDVGNPELSSERGMALEIGLEQRFLPGVKGAIAAFQRTVRDMIAWVPSGSGDLWSPANINQYVLNGAEVEFTARKGDLDARVSYTYLDGRQTNQEVVYSDWITGELHLEDISRLAAFIPVHTVGFDLTYRGTLLKINLNSEYKSEIVNYYPDYSNAPAVSMTKKVLPERTAMSGKVSWLIGKLKPFLEIRNLLNSTYSEQFGSLSDGNYPLPGRTYGIGLQAEF